MDLAKLVDLATRLDLPDLAERGVRIARDAANFAAVVKQNAARARNVLTDGNRAELDAIHAEALAAADALDAKLAEAAQR